MGKKIDGFVLSVLVAGTLYLYFYRVFENHAASIALSGVCFVLLSRLFRKTYSLLSGSRWSQKRRMRRLSGGTLMHLACAEIDEARESISSLLEKCYGTTFPVEIVQQPPSSALSQQQLFDLWKAHRQEEKLVICATCVCDASCRALASSLKQPRIALLDANMLAQLIAEHPENIYIRDTPAKRKALQLKRLSALLINRRNAPRCLLFAAALLLMYLMSARISYLAASMLLIFLSLAAFRKASRPAKLF